MANRRVLVKRRKSVAQHPQDHADDAARSRPRASRRRSTAPWRPSPTPRSWPSWWPTCRGRAGRRRAPAARDRTTPARRAALVVLTSDRGLARRLQLERPARRARAPRGRSRRRGRDDATSTWSARRGSAYFRFLRQRDGRADRRRRRQAALRPGRADRQRADGPLPRAARSPRSHVAYMRFHLGRRQRPEVVQLLPLAAARRRRGRAEAAGAAGRVRVLARRRSSSSTSCCRRPCACGSSRPSTTPSVSEQVARMVAMKAATDAADDMIKAPDAASTTAPGRPQITMELLDIVGGANALA